MLLLILTIILAPLGHLPRPVERRVVTITVDADRQNPRRTT